MPPAPKDATGADGKKLIRRLAGAFAQCSDAAKLYGICMSGYYDGVQKGQCDAEFQALKKCFRTQLASARASGR